jgi:GT2 family glycosyltransferase
VKVVAGEKPFIFARNANIGIRAAGDDDVILLNDDALLKTPCGFSELRSLAHLNPEYGIIASSCNNVGNQNQLPKARGLREDPRMVCFVCVYIPRRTIDTVGLLDQRFAGYGVEDDDYCLRVRQAGLKIGIWDGCFVDHQSLSSEYRGQGSGDFRANLKRFIEKHGFDNWGMPKERSNWPELFA